MANIKAQANGNFADTATWSGGVVPGSGDNAYSNGYVVTVAASATCAQVSNAVGSGITAGGYFDLADGVTLTANVLGGFNVTSPSNGGAVCLQGTASATIVGNITGGSGASMRGVLHASSGTLTITGSVTGGSTSNCYGLYQTGISSTCTITGSVTGSGNNAYGLYQTGTSSTCTITGSVTGGTIGTAYGLYQAGTSSTCTITGSVVGASANGYNQTNGTCLIAGTLTPSASASAVNGTGGVVVVDTAELPCHPSTGVVAIAHYCWKWYATSAGVKQEVMTDDVYATIRPLYTLDYDPSAFTFPVQANVRDGTAYGTGGLLIGTLKVPPPQSVAYGVPVDATTGTAVLDGASAATVGALIAAAFP